MRNAVAPLWSQEVERAWNRYTAKREKADILWQGYLVARLTDCKENGWSFSQPFWKQYKRASQAARKAFAEFTIANKGEVLE